MAEPTDRTALKPCCGREPTLRLHERITLTGRIPFVRYECRECEAVGGVAMTEIEAAILWE